MVKVILVFVQNLYSPFGARSEVLYLVAGREPQLFDHHLLIQWTVCPVVKMARWFRCPKQHSPHNADLLSFSTLHICTSIVDICS